MYFIGVKLCTFFAMTPDGTVLIWLPNAFALTTLLYYRGQRYWLFMALIIIAEITGDVPLFSWNQALMLGLTNVIEVTLAYQLMRKLDMSPMFNKLEDVIKFIIAGPMVASLIGALIGATILYLSGTGHSEYLFIVQTWWFGDALGLIIGTPLFLTVLYNVKQTSKPLNSVDIMVAAISVCLFLLLIVAKDSQYLSLVITPTLIIPFMLYLALRTNLKWTAIAVAIFSFTIAMLISIGRNPFGNLPLPITILHAQEFIAILSLACLGFAILIAHIRNHESELEAQVSIRTHELQLLNQKLEEQSAIDSMTGLANRRRFDDVLEVVWAHNMRAQQFVTLLFLDIDWFKQYNDRYGHQAGDECLRKVSQVLSKKFTRAGDLVARYGGEEFVLLTSGMDSQQAHIVSKELCSEIQA